MNKNNGLIQKTAQEMGTMQNPSEKAIKPIERLKNILSAESVQEQFKSVLKENSGAFVASIIDLYNNDKSLQTCDPKSVVMEALKAASLKLPVNKQLGFAWIVPYKNKGVMTPTFQIGYKGYIQLAMRTGSYKYINSDVVYEGELLSKNKLTGEIDIDPGKKTSDKKIGYFAYIESLNGFKKTLYMSIEDVMQHAKKYSKSYSFDSSTWSTDFDAMALKTCIRLLLSKYGIMSIEMVNAFTEDSGDTREYGDDGIDPGTDETIDVDYQVVGGGNETTEDQKQS